MQGHMHVSAYVWRPEVTLECPFLSCTLPYILRQVLSWDLELTDLGRPGWPASPRRLSISPSLVLGYRHPFNTLIYLFVIRVSVI